MVVASWNLCGRYPAERPGRARGHASARRQAGWQAGWQAGGVLVVAHPQSRIPSTPLSCTPSPTSIHALRAQQQQPTACISDSHTQPAHIMFKPPRYLEGAISERYSGTDWLAQPMPKPRQIRPRMSMARFWAAAFRVEPSRNLRCAGRGSP